MYTLPLSILNCEKLNSDLHSVSMTEISIVTVTGQYKHGCSSFIDRLLYIQLSMKLQFSDKSQYGVWKPFGEMTR